MKFSERWLRTMVDPALDTAGLCDRLTMAGLEVESVGAGGTALLRGRGGPDREGRSASERRPPARVSRGCRRGRAAAHRLRRAQRRRRHEGPLRDRRRAASGRTPHRQGDDARRRIAGHALLGQRARHRRRRVRFARASRGCRRRGRLARRARPRRHADHAQDHAEPRRLPVGPRHRARRRGDHRCGARAARRRAGAGRRAARSAPSASRTPPPALASSRASSRGSTPRPRRRRG